MDLNIVEILMWAAVFYLFYKLGQWSVLWPIKLAVRHMAERRGMDPESFLRSELRDMGTGEHTDSAIADRPRLEIERYAGTYYAYENGQFLAQAQDFQALFETLRTNFPGRTFTVDRYDANFTEDEAQQLVQSIFKVYGGKSPKEGPDQ